MDQATGPLADALHRDLFSDGRTLDELGWRGLWAYITTAPPNTAIHYRRCEGWTLAEKIAAEQLYEERKLGWRYGAVHFQGGKDYPFPEPIDYPGRALPAEAAVSHTWESATLDELVSPEVRALLQGGAPSRN